MDVLLRLFGASVVGRRGAPTNYYCYYDCCYYYYSSSYFSYSYCSCSCSCCCCCYYYDYYYYYWYDGDDERKLHERPTKENQYSIFCEEPSPDKTIDDQRSCLQHRSSQGRPATPSPQHSPGSPPDGEPTARTRSRMTMMTRSSGPTISHVSVCFCHKHGKVMRFNMSWTS